MEAGSPDLFVTAARPRQQQSKPSSTLPQGGRSGLRVPCLAHAGSRRPARHRRSLQPQRDHPPGAHRARRPRRTLSPAPHHPGLQQRYLPPARQRVDPALDGAHHGPIVRLGYRLGHLLGGPHCTNGDGLRVCCAARQHLRG
ncbi:uncharacterized protein BO72DRAFT_19327 [Aspergillus fijiensis CBS 313.89]|uniref:Uncharacterized protein n=1 Tax=Aspergillus fijiensis CBS 313.89 TaxID=1448319 RepID=A0A8G1VSQ2_9EURO|nr:uncharacterized protein BO72DRAFT_19327 [Aspergillus fijiensis CBS 313.89]RAK71267.1 hypothetical protein BO72DRAFT_19327 [Aspergillus fijiensis CBS 313.89]